MTNFAVTLVRGPAWDPSLDIRSQSGWDAHADFMDRLVDDGFILLGGPVGDFRQTLHVVEAADEDALRRRLGDDPWARDRRLEVGSIQPWALWLDSRTRRFVDQDLTGAEFRECDLTGARLIGVVAQDVEIDGLVSGLVVNGVEVSGYVEAELDRRHPVRLLLRSDDLADLGEAWRVLGDQWSGTVARVRALTGGAEHTRVNGEWSAVETLRHLIFVHDSWFRRCVLGRTEPFTPMGLGPDVAFERGDLDRTAAPSLPDVVAVREGQHREVAEWIARATAEQLSQPAPVPDDDRWPPYARGRTVRRCLGTVLTEEHEHRLICERDLDRLTARP